MLDARKKKVWMLWKRCWTDKSIFKQSRVMIVQSDIVALLDDLEVGVHENDQLDNISILPVNPTQVLCKENARIVDKLARRQLVRACRQGGPERYTLELSEMG